MPIRRDEALSRMNLLVWYNSPMDPTLSVRKSFVSFACSWVDISLRAESMTILCMGPGYRLGKIPDRPWRISREYKVFMTSQFVKGKLSNFDLRGRKCMPPGQKASPDFIVSNFSATIHAHPKEQSLSLEFF